jgi:hypothetical protein
MKSYKEYLSEAGHEQQEVALLSSIKNFINKQTKKTGKDISITLKDRSGNTYTNIIRAEKAPTNAIGKENYTDVILLQDKMGDYSGQTIRISMKEFSAPSVFTGGLESILSWDYQLGKDIMGTALQHYIDKGYNEKTPSTKIKDVSIPLKLFPKDKIKKLIIGTSDMGGPIDCYFFGPKTPKFEFDEKTNTITAIDSDIVSIKELLKNIDELYVVIRKRRLELTFTKDTYGGKKPDIQKVFSPEAGRLVGHKGKPRGEVVDTFINNFVLKSKK